MLKTNNLEQSNKPVELLPAYERPVDKVSIDARMSAQLNREAGAGAQPPQAESGDTKPPIKKFIFGGKEFVAAVAAAVAMTGLPYAAFEFGTRDKGPDTGAQIAKEAAKQRAAVQASAHKIEQEQEAIKNKSLAWNP